MVSRTVGIVRIISTNVLVSWWIFMKSLKYISIFSLKSFLFGKSCCDDSEWNEESWSSPPPSIFNSLKKVLDINRVTRWNFLHIGYRWYRITYHGDQNLKWQSRHERRCLRNKLALVTNIIFLSYQTDAISSCCLQTFFIAASRALSMTRRPLNLKTLASLELQMNPIGPPAWCSNIGHKGWSLSGTSLKTPLGGLLFQDA